MTWCIYELQGRFKAIPDNEDVTKYLLKKASVMRKTFRYNLGKAMNAGGKYVSYICLINVFHLYKCFIICLIYVFHFVVTDIEIKTKVPHLSLKDLEMLRAYFDSPAFKVQNFIV